MPSADSIAVARGTVGQAPLLSPLVIHRNEVHLWQVHLVECIDADLLDQYAALLSTVERERYRDLLFAAHRHTFLVSRALVRIVLSRYLQVPAPDLAFTAGPKGKPRISLDTRFSRSFEFNLSHTEGIAVLAVTAGQAVGVDVESLGREALVEVVARQFSVSEAHHVQSCPAWSRARRFWELWTLKESYLKATGLGLSASLSAFRFDLARQGAIDVSAAPAWSDQPHGWWFAQWEPSNGHLASLCMAREHSAVPPLVRAHNILPLHTEVDISASLQLVRQSF